MILLSSAIACDARCPHCAGELEPGDWLMPGMRALVQTRCASCRLEYFADLPTGQALYSPMLLEIESGVVHDRWATPWFAQWLADGYRARSSRAVPFRRISHRPVARPVVLLNCIDTLYGHSVLKLLNAQHHIDEGQFDVVVVVQPFLEWLVPDGVAECWVVDLSLLGGSSWNDAISTELRTQCTRFAEVYLAPAHSHPRPSAFAIERFTRVAPFDLRQWDSARPAVTFVWRDDRLWPSAKPGGVLARSGLRAAIGGARAKTARQERQVIALFSELRRLLPAVDVAVVGLGAPSPLPEWIRDLRLPSPDADAERAWCVRYARSHAVIGVHGSNMLLPSAHAGSAIEIAGDERMGNFLQDILLNGTESRGVLFRYRFVAPEISPEALARLTAFVVQRYPAFENLMSSAEAPEGEAVVRH